MRRDVEAGRLELPTDGRFEVEVKLADGSALPRRRASSTSPTCASIAQHRHAARRAPSCPTPTARCAPGQFVRVRLHGAMRPDAIVVPQRAVLEGPQGKFVYVVDAESKAEPRPVQVGDWAGDDWIINVGPEAGRSR